MRSGDLKLVTKAKQVFPNLNAIQDILSFCVEGNWTSSSCVQVENIYTSVVTKTIEFARFFCF